MKHKTTKHKKRKKQKTSQKAYAPAYRGGLHHNQPLVLLNLSRHTKPDVNQCRAAFAGDMIIPDADHPNHAEAKPF